MTDLGKCPECGLPMDETNAEEVGMGDFVHKDSACVESAMKRRYGKDWKPGESRPYVGPIRRFLAGRR